MEVAFSALVGELAQRSISFFIDRLSKPEKLAMPTEETLRRKLLRVHVVVEEAEGRQITSRSMLEQLKLLREAMYRGYFVLDSFKYRSCQEPESNKEDNDGDIGVTRSFALSKINSAKRVQLLLGRSSRGAIGEDDLRRVLLRLDAIITDTGEFASFLAGYPRLRRQPHDTYMLLERCMFGRHVEMEHIINFLLQRGTGDLEVLPIVGPSKAGKSTLIEHACNDERVRRAFSRIVFFTEDDLGDEEGGTIKHESRRRALKDCKILVILELEGDIDDDAWRKSYAASKSYPAGDRRMIISSRSDKIARFGTAQALRVRFLTPEAYWYFFKALAFGSTNPEAEPKLASLAMEIAADLNGSFVVGNIIASLLRANFSAKFWRMAMSTVRECRRRYPFMFGALALPVSPWQLAEQAQFPLIGTTGQCLSMSNDRQIVSTGVEAPLIKMRDVMTGSVVLPDGKFEALAWKSTIPPYYSYTFTCEMQKPRPVPVRKKRVYDLTFNC
ncbi:putative disease resistance protein RGA1 [Lolium perenne]|uniref:putative disease resistance protein RGA1 n=1 Tax=Lolium perenne TaxID=4522 RepID=UPI0021EA1F95|nr:putative disease resistance protein RGA3 [Lolium perenne]